MSGKNSPKEQELTGFAAFCNYIWNSRTGEFCGRTGSSWAKIILFYIIFYACLAAFWAFMLYIFLETINDERPKWTLDESRIGSNPGLGFRPTPPPEKIDSTLIHFRPGNADSYSHWKNDLESYLKPYREAFEKASPECRRIPAKNCTFAPNLNENPCGSEFGYDRGSPCVLVKLNRIFDWKPEPFRNVNDLRSSKHPDDDTNTKRSDIVVKGTDLNSGEGLVVLNCKGENSADEEYSGQIDYWPMQGFPAEYFPYTNQKGYLSPFVFVKFNRPKKGTVINIECTAHAKNIAIKKQDREGNLRFELLIDE